MANICETNQHKGLVPSTLSYFNGSWGYTSLRGSKHLLNLGLQTALKTKSYSTKLEQGEGSEMPSVFVLFFSSSHQLWGQRAKQNINQIQIFQSTFALNNSHFKHLQSPADVPFQDQLTLQKRLLSPGCFQPRAPIPPLLEFTALPEKPNCLAPFLLQSFQQQAILAKSDYLNGLIQMNSTGLEETREQAHNHPSWHGHGEEQPGAGRGDKQLWEKQRPQLAQLEPEKNIHPWLK